MEKVLLCSLFLVVFYAVAYHQGKQSGKREMIIGFRKQVESHKNFYNHNLKTSGKKTYHLIGE